MLPAGVPAQNRQLGGGARPNEETCTRKSRTTTAAHPGRARSRRDAAPRVAVRAARVQRRRAGRRDSLCRRPRGHCPRCSVAPARFHRRLLLLLFLAVLISPSISARSPTASSGASHGRAGRRSRCAIVGTLACWSASCGSLVPPVDRADAGAGQGPPRYHPPVGQRHRQALARNPALRSRLECRTTPRPARRARAGLALLRRGSCPSCSARGELHRSRSCPSLVMGVYLARHPGSIAKSHLALPAAAPRPRARRPHRSVADAACLDRRTADVDDAARHPHRDRTLGP